MSEQVVSPDSSAFPSVSLLLSHPDTHTHSWEGQMHVVKKKVVGKHLFGSPCVSFALGRTVL